MRADAIGLFWEDVPTGRKGSERIRVMPPIPETGWVTPRESDYQTSADAKPFVWIPKPTTHSC